MEFRIPTEEYSDDDDEVLSFCDLVTEQGVQALRDSNTGSFEQEGFGFDFDFGLCDLTSNNVCPADDLFRHGRLIPLAPQRCRTESVQYSFFDKSNSEYLLTWRKDSLDLQSSFRSSSSPRFSSSRSQRKIQYDEILRLSNSKSKRKQKPPSSGGKMSGIWRLLTLGLMKPPPLKLEEMRLRQGNSNNNINGAKNLDLRRSASCISYKDPKLEEKEAKAVNFKEKCRSVKEHVVVKKTPWLNGWKTLAKLPSFNSNKTSSNTVVENGR